MRKRIRHLFKASAVQPGFIECLLFAGCSGMSVTVTKGQAGMETCDGTFRGLGEAVVWSPAPWPGGGGSQREASSFRERGRRRGAGETRSRTGRVSGAEALRRLPASLNRGGGVTASDIREPQLQVSFSLGGPDS